ncbi:aminotransferase class V-fold PLP-dependent enzyme [Sorangium sp. So ce1504]|uniref:aminotransferase class V-fold PLP-dependent enzyme n=1 Tax=Sorangium sp. So ce1504 TaxID=3133337 RepID=UPI003F5E9E6E
MELGFSLDLDAFRAAYSRFLAPAGDVAPRILLTGHSHQAWPDVAREALCACFDDAAQLVDGKWDAAVLPKLAAVGAAILERMGFERGDAIAFGQNTHELVYRLITSLPRRERLRIVTTQGEFHSLRRQLARLAEEGVEIDWVSVEPRHALADRLLAALRPGTSMLAISAVLFESATVVPRLDEIVARAAEIGAVPLVDAYHAFNVVPLAWGSAAPHVFSVAGGYKYAAMGEGICWMRVPHGCGLRPVFTGWFADFGSLAGSSGGVAYAPGGARFAGSTFDPSALYRAAAVIEHWDRFGLTVPRLRAISLRQTGRILDLLDAAGRGGDVVSPREPERRGGFVGVRSARAGDVVERLRARRVLVDARRDVLRIGPAPYLTDAEIDQGVSALVEELGR